MMRGRGQTYLLIRITLLFKAEADLNFFKYIKISNRTSHFQWRSLGLQKSKLLILMKYFLEETGIHIKTKPFQIYC